MKYGLSMFGLGPVFLKDKEYFMRRIAAAGYQYLEPCVVAQQIPQLKEHFWTFEDMENYYPLLQSHNVGVCSFHMYPKDLSKEWEELAVVAQKYHADQIVIPCPQFENADQGALLAKTITEVSEKLYELGIELLLHNGKGDSEGRVESISAYEWMLRHCGPHVGSQADVGWLTYGGVDPVAFLARNESKIRSLHYKDMELTSEGMREIGVGRGIVDMEACFRFAESAGIVQILDQDSSRGDFLDDLDYVMRRFQELSKV